MARSDHYAALLSQVPADIRPLVPGFLNRREKEVEDLWNLLEMTDFRSIQDAGHKLKGTGTGYGFEMMTEIGRDLENAAKDQNFEHVKQIIERLAEATRNLQRVMREQKS